jgi:hypothetical protein
MYVSWKLIGISPRQSNLSESHAPHTPASLLNPVPGRSWDELVIAKAPISPAALLAFAAFFLLCQPSSQQKSVVDAFCPEKGSSETYYLLH